jgi:hypothetical protein
MSTASLTFLQERLVREAPNFDWKCEPLQQGCYLQGTNLPEQIEVRATHAGAPRQNTTFYLSGECLKRWGVDASATMICNEVTASAQKRGRGLDWDRLAEF